MLIADRSNDAVAAKAAVQQIETAYQTLGSDGDEEESAYFQAKLAVALAILDRLAPATKL